MDRDAKICYCFRVTRRKLESFVRLEQPTVASRLSECGGAGTGCGWCVPFLQQIFRAARGEAAPELDALGPEEYERRRQRYLDAGKRREPE